MVPKRLAFVDVETTGSRPTYDRIIEVGVLTVEDGKIIKEFKQLINPQMYVPPYIQMLTGISQEALEDAPSFADIRDELYEMLKDTTFVAHNVRFDYSFIRNEFKRFGLPFRSNQLCTVKLSRTLYPQFKKHDLTTIIERHGFDCEHRHRAFDDAHVLWQFFQKIVGEFNEKTVNKALKLIQKRPTFPKNINPDVIDEIPETFGVYKFFDKEGALLYIGKSNNLRARILAHFSSDYTSTKQMNLCQNIAHIEYIPTAGELGALLRESHLIKTLSPIYNRALRRQNRLVVLLKDTDENGYDRVKMDTLQSIPVTNIESVLGVFSTRKKAQDFLFQMVKKYSLCEQIMGLNSFRRPCFGYKLKTCKGACLGEENSKIYNLRFLLAFSENKLKPWYFGHPVEIIEKNPLLGLYEKFVVDKWCLISSIASENQENLAVDNEINFDVDIYDILTRFLRKTLDHRISTLRTAQPPQNDFETEFAVDF